MQEPPRALGQLRAEVLQIVPLLQHRPPDLLAGLVGSTTRGRDGQLFAWHPSAVSGALCGHGRLTSPTGPGTAAAPAEAATAAAFFCARSHRRAAGRKWPLSTAAQTCVGAWSTARTWPFEMGKAAGAAGSVWVFESVGDGCCDQGSARHLSIPGWWDDARAWAAASRQGMSRLRGCRASTICCGVCECVKSGGDDEKRQRA